MKKFRGKIYVDIREYFAKGRDMFPTKKGIYLPVESWKVLTEKMASIHEEMLKLNNPTTH